MQNELNEENDKLLKKKTKFPVVALRGRVAFPNVLFTIDVIRTKSIEALKKASMGNSYIFLMMQKDQEVTDPGIDDLYEIGVVAQIKQVVKMPTDSITKVSLKGIYRAVAKKVDTSGKYIEAEVLREDAVLKNEIECEAYARILKDRYIEILKVLGKEFLLQSAPILGECNYSEFSDILAYDAIKKISQQYEILSISSVEERLKLMINYLNEEAEIAKIQKKIAGRVKTQIDKNQKEYLLREQMKAISDELGENEDEIKKLSDAVKKLNIPNKETEEKVLKDINKLIKIPAASPENNVLRGYIDWVLDLPWTKETEDNKDINKAKEILDEDHYGLFKVKERILEFLAVHTLKKGLKSPILCFVGPPGVGKTSIAKSIARALGRKFVRMSLGGVKDEAEIRGHRRTYVGAMPGRIIYNIKLAKSNNPVFLLDEIDKMSSDLRGDPLSAMLEVLDPEQNSTFRDHYMEVPYDLSKVMFITTANTLDSIPAPLRDRMEIVELSGYTEDEKIEIAKHFLLKRQEEEHGINAGSIEITDKAYRKVIFEYTSESGVRSLNRQIAQICRKVALKVLITEKFESIKIDDSSIKEYLGIPRYLDKHKEDKNEIGAATGLAWTEVGGTTLTIEVSLMKGKGELVLTGKLGEVMRESAMAALSFIRANSKTYNIDEEVFKTTDIHIHVPNGATPKDGPSAGITMATAILSALTKRPVSKNVAMTGEITLRGRVLPIGGLKEKTLAAHRAGITTIILPKDNAKDMEEIPEKIKNDLSFILVDNISSVFQNSII